MSGDHLITMTQAVRELNIKNGWRDNTPDGNDNTVGDDIALIHSEVSEMLEAYRVHGMDEYTDKLGKPDDVGSEIADVFIRLLDFCDRRGIDLDREYARKMEYNHTRTYRHGGKKL